MSKNSTMIHTTELKFNSEHKTLTGYLPMNVSYNTEVLVKSHHTGTVVEFVPMPYEHELMDQDGWDGMLLAFVPKTPVRNVKSLFLMTE